MKAELTLPQEIVNEIADEVIERLKPLLSGTGKPYSDVKRSFNTALRKAGILDSALNEKPTIQKLYNPIKKELAINA